MGRERGDVVGMDGAILMNRAGWKASGHEDTFTDPKVDCFLTGKRFRADQVEPQSGLAFSYSGAVDLSRFEEAFDRVTHNRATNVKREIRQNKNRIYSMISDWKLSADPNYRKLAADVLS